MCDGALTSSFLCHSERSEESRAAETLRFSQDAQTAFAFFSGADPSGCVLTEVSVIAVDERRKEGAGPGEERSEAVAAISRYDQCAGTLLLAADGRAALAPAAFQIDDLAAATLNTAIELFDSVSGSSFAVDVALTWEGVGDPRRDVPDRRRVAYHVPRDPRQARHGRRNRSLRIDQCLEYIGDLPIGDRDGAELGDAVATPRTATRGLDVHDDVTQ